MTNPAQIARTATVAAGAAYAVVLYLAGIRLGQGFKQGLAYLPTAVGLAAVAFDKWLWKIKPVHRFLPRPRLDGIWAATLKPVEGSHIPEGGNWGPIEAYVVVEQSYWSINIRQYTRESTSDSKAASFTERANSKQQTLVFVYENQPRQEHLHRSPRHVGACELDIMGTTPEVVTGFYFTDRLTKGDMELRLCGRATGYSSFQAAQEYCQQ